MDIVEFRKEYGKEWDKFTAKPIFTALMSVLEEESPTSKAADRLDGDVVVAGSHLYAQIKGWEALKKLLKKGLGDSQEDKDLPADYKTEQQI